MISVLYGLSVERHVLGFGYLHVCWQSPQKKWLRPVVSYTYMKTVFEDLHADTPVQRDRTHRTS